MNRAVLGAALCVAVLGCKTTESGPEQSSGVGDAWFVGRYMRAGERPAVAPPCAAINQITVTDPRPDPVTVGRRYHEEQPGLVYAIKMNGAATAWVKDGIESQARQAAMALGTAGRADLVVSIRMLDLQEKVFSNSNYEARVVLDATVPKAGTNTPCWSGSFEGSSKNYGRSGSQDNYQETANHALDKAALDLLNADGLRDALCGKCGGGGGKPSGPTSTEP